MSTTHEIEPGRRIDLSCEVVGLDRSDRRARLVEQNAGRPPHRIDGFTVGAPMLTGDAPHGGEMHPDGDELVYMVSGRDHRAARVARRRPDCRRRRRGGARRAEGHVASHQPAGTRSAHPHHPRAPRRSPAARARSAMTITTAAAPLDRPGSPVSGARRGSVGRGTRPARARRRERRTPRRPTRA